MADSDQTRADIKRIGPFALVEKIGAGGMGVVFRATHGDSGKEVAVKVLAPKSETSRRDVLRFERELAILQKIQHPNIVRCYGGGRAGGKHFMAMELVRGGSLSEILKRRGKLSWEAAIDYSLQVCSALECAHEQGIIHRDLKPGNLLLAKDGTLKLSDFGLARLTFGEKLTATNHTLGTLAYMSPEQIHGESGLSHKTDLYALGCVMFEMLTGRPPFMGDSTAILLYQHLQQEPPRVVSLTLDCPVWLDALVAQLLEKKPEKRPRDAAAVIQALREVKERAASGQGVAQHVAKGGAAALRVTTPDSGAVARLLPKRKKKSAAEWAEPFYERAWFLSICLAALAGVATWIFWPAGEEKLFARASALMVDDASTDRARLEVLGELQERFPEGAHAAEVRQFVEQIEMKKAEKQADAHVRQGLAPESEGERLYMEAREYERFGDRITALEKYRAMQTVLESNAANRPYLNLSRRHVAKLEETTEDDDRLKTVQKALDNADQLALEGKALAAYKIWSSVVTLYGDNQEMAIPVKRAKARIRETDTASDDQENSDNSSADDIRGADEAPAERTTDGDEAEQDIAESDAPDQAAEPDE